MEGNPELRGGSGVRRRFVGRRKCGEVIFDFECAIAGRRAAPARTTADVASPGYSRRLYSAVL